MASLTIRNLDDSLKRRLRVRAARHGRSMEAEARHILAKSLFDEQEAGGLVASIRKRFAETPGDGLSIPVRQNVRNPPELLD